MHKHEKNVSKNIILGLMLGATTLYHSSTAYAADNAVVPNNQVPHIGDNNPQKGVTGNVSINSGKNNVLDVMQDGKNAVIKWNDFSIGANATVNFNEKNGNVFNTLNYVNGGDTSKIYGTINADKGNIYLVNPSGVQIGNSAQINVGSFYVSNKQLDENKLGNFNGSNLSSLVSSSSPTNAELMNLGNINATQITFDGDRVVLDIDRITGIDNATPNLAINSANDDVVLGYSTNNNINITGLNNLSNYKYSWIKDSDDLNNISANGKYALRNSIDMTGVTYTPKDSFTGKFDGLGYNIFGLKIADGENTGLFRTTNGATLSNINLISGSVTGTNNVGSLVGTATDTTINNVINTLHVTGTTNTGGIVGVANNTTINGAINTGTITGNGNVTGGIAGSLENSKIIGTTYNLGKVISTGANVGGIAGTAANSTIGNDNTTDFQIYNHMSVTGDYNVGGIVGAMDNSTVQNVKNEGDVKATGSTSETYKYHTDNASVDKQDSDDKNTIDGFASEIVDVANVGGITGISSNTSAVKNVINQGDITTAKTDKHYNAGNIGGIVGRATDTTIDTAENKENKVLGAHNVGGVAGYLETSTITNSTNNGGEIQATGAISSDTKDFATEIIRVDGSSDDTFIIGNMGGIAGYMYGNDTFINASSNRGTIHSLDIEDGTADADILPSSKAANVGGIVGKVDRDFSSYLNTNNITGYLDYIKNDSTKAAINNSYNTGNVQGYTGIGGIAGFMYNGEIANSYNLGDIRTTRISAGKGGANMGGILGDTMERSLSRAVLYNVYNKGNIGGKDENQNIHYYGRHVGGVAGRFAGIIDTAYNAGNIYNGAAVTGGVVGFWTAGKIQNVFNTGNITVKNNSIQSESTTLGGVVGSARAYTQYINGREVVGDTGTTKYTIKVLDNTSLDLNNAYNLGTLRAFVDTAGGNTVGGIIGQVQNLSYNIYPVYTTNISNVYTTGNLFAETKDNTSGEYIATSSDNVNAIYTEPGTASSWEHQAHVNLNSAYYIAPKDTFTELNGTKLNGATKISYTDSLNSPANNFANLNSTDWRFYNGTTPILNAFMPKLGTDDNFNKATGLDKSVAQFGTAYNPLLTIVNGKDVTINDAQTYLGLSDGVAVYNGDLTLNNTGKASGNTSLMYSGTLYSDGVLTLKNGVSDSSNTSFNFGSGANLYGSSVNLIGDDSDTVNINGTVTATDGAVTINGKDVNIYGSVKSSQNGEVTSIDGIAQNASDLDFSNVDINKLDADIPNTGTQYQTTKTASKSGDINITAQNGDINALYGNMQKGSLTAGNDLNLNTSGKVYVDSDLSVGNNLNANGTAENIIDITNTTDQANLLNKTLILNGDNSKITVDVWDYDNDKFDDSKLSNLENASDTIKNKVYTWISSADQLNALNAYQDSSNVLKNQFALKNDIDASGITSYNTIDSFAGNFDGRDNRILDLDTGTSGKGLFDTIETSGTVENLKIYSSTVNGGAVANTNNGTIENIETLGNTVNVDGNIAGGIVATNTGTIDNASDRGTIQGVAGATIGGIAGKNSGTIFNSMSNSDVAGDKTDTASLSGGIVGENSGTIANAESLGITKGYSAGGIVGNSTSGSISQAYNESLVSGTTNIGGIAGANQAGSSVENAVNATKIEASSDNVGGLVGDNYGSVTNGRNNGEINGRDNVGGLVGVNNGSMLNDLNNDSSAKIVGRENVGGIAGQNTSSGTIDVYKQDLINRGSITGTKDVGGIVGENAGTINGEGLTNEIELNVKADTSGNIQTENFGGVAGINTSTGKINGATNSGKLTVTGANKVGGIVGENSGSLSGNIENQGTVDGTNSTSVGGIIGQNNADFTNAAMKNSGDVKGNDKVGGVIGENDGTVTGGRDENGNYYKYQIYNNGAVSANNNNAGGLIGNNTGALTAGYNTGSVNGANNVGGIAGTNSGKIDQVFNTLASGKTLTGTTNVGGLIGTNVNGGKLSNAYNSTAISGKNNVGNAVGNNAGSLENIYGEGKVVGAGSGSQKNVYTIDKDNATDKATYTNFDGTNVWRFQDGNTSPLLKVFLTKVQVNKDANVDWDKIVYNGKLQGFVAKAENNMVNIYRANADGTATSEKVGYISAIDDYGAHSLADYLNTGKDNGDDLISSSLQKNAGTYEMFYSHQINTNGADGSPNNLGYDFTSGVDYDGNNPNDPYNPQNPNNPHNPDNPFNPNNPNYVPVDPTNPDKTVPGNDNPYDPISPSYNPDNPYNPKVDNPNAPTNPPTYTIGKKKINIELTDVGRDYGNANIKDGNYGFTVDGWVDGENYSDKLSLDKSSIKDNALASEANRTTNDVGNYTWHGDVLGVDDLQNYELENSIGSANSRVDKAKLYISADSKNIYKGQHPSYTGSHSDLVNGDTWEGLGGGKFAISDNDLENQIGIHAGQIGVFIGDKFYTQGSDVFKNYDLQIKPGTLVVKSKPYMTPVDGWGRKRHFRERRAEFNYVIGGTKIAEKQVPQDNSEIKTDDEVQTK